MHQLLLLSLQRLSSNIGASDASCAPSDTDSVADSSCTRRKRHQNVLEQSSVLPLVQSIKDLAECQRQLVLIVARNGVMSKSWINNER